MSSADCRVVSIPDCRAAARWPGSGGTPLSQGKDGIRRGLEGLVTAIAGAEESSGLSMLGAIAERLRRSITRKPQPEIAVSGLVRTTIEIAESTPALQQLPEPVVYSSANSKIAELPTSTTTEEEGTGDLRRLVGNVRFS
ncbi:MAG: hypothetical protein EBZ48_17715 [Proteobacteria bacterium]|nr:hypothetical protein [Pseudomonadota bacterium]